MARRRLLGIPLAGAVLTVAFVGPGVTASLEGCATQETTPPIDAAPPPCKSGLTVHCQPVAFEALGCSSDEGTSPLLAELPRGTRYPVDCSIYFVGARDENGDCQNDAVCKCLVTDVPAPGPFDGGSSDAALPPPPPPSGPTTAPMWICD